MKTMFKSFALVAIAALSLAACSKNEAPINDENDLITLKFNIKNTDEASTRALLGDDNGKKFLNWENGDKIGTFSVGTFSSNTASNNNSGTVEVSGDNYTLNVQTFWSGTITNIYSYFPYSAAAGKDKTAAIVNIPGSQFMATDGFDADAMPMAGTPVSVDLTTTAANTDTPCGTINFFNLGSIINFKIYSSIETDETLTSVKYVAGTGNLGGNYTVDLTAIDGADETTLALVGEGSEAEITTTHRATPVIGTGKANAIDVYMVVAPGSYSGTQVVVTTSAKTYTLNASGVKTYTRSSVKPMYVDIQNGTPGDLPVEETWTKVTKASDFTAGTYYILRGDGAYYLPNASATSGAPACVAYNAGDAITNAMKWTATAGDNGLVFESVANAGYYLWGANTNNGVRVAESSTASGASKEWKFTTVTVGETTYYTAYAYATRYLTSYGNQDWRNYTSASATNIPAEFYKLDVVDDTPSFTVESPLAATADEDTYTVNVTRNNFTGAITVTVPGDCDWVIAENVAENGTTFDVLVSENTGSARTVTLTLSGSGVESQELIINQAGNDPGTEVNPYTVSQAISAANELGKNETTANDVYVTGVVSTVSSFNSSYKSITYFISADGTTTTQLEVYSGKGLNGADFSALTDLAIGDQVIIKGKLQNYNGTTPEIYMNSQITSIVMVPRYTISLGSVSHGTISASATNVAAGVVINLTANAAEGYKFDSWSVTENESGNAVTVTNDAFTMPSANVTVSASFVENTSGVPDPVTMNVFSNAATVSGSNATQTATWTSGDITVTAVRNDSGNTAFRSSDSDHTRFYKGWTITVSSAANTIDNVVFTCTADSYATVLAGCEFTKGTAAASGSVVTVSDVDASSTAVTLDDGQVRVSSIKVTYK